MKHILLSLSGIVAGALMLSAQHAVAQNVNDAVEMVRSIYKTDRQTFVADLESSCQRKRTCASGIRANGTPCVRRR